MTRITPSYWLKYVFTKHTKSKTNKKRSWCASEIFNKRKEHPCYTEITRLQITKSAKIKQIRMLKVSKIAYRHLRKRCNQHHYHHQQHQQNNNNKTNNDTWNDIDNINKYNNNYH